MLQDFPPPGKLIYLMGASGSGKDTLLHAARALIPQEAPHLRRLVIVQRHITRPLPANSQDEQHLPCTEQEFLARLAQGEYVMHWQSHGLYYGITQEVEAGLVRGAVVLVNGSREYLPEAQSRYPSLIPVLIRVDPEALKARLEARGRESAEEIEKRVQRARMELPPTPNMIVIDNSHALDSTLQEFTSFITMMRTIQSA